MNNPEQQFIARIVAACLIPPDPVIGDGKLHRFDADGRKGKKSGWYVLHLDGVPAGAFGCYRTLPDGLSWCSKPADKMTEAERQAHRERVANMQRQREQEIEARYAEGREVAKLIWAAADPCESHPYTTRKGVQPHGARIITAAKAKKYCNALSPELWGDLLVIPMRDTAGVIHSLQFITADGIKRPLTGGRKRGCYHGTGKPDKVLCIAEGFATGATIHEATGHAVAVAFDAGNLLAVAQALRAKFPDLLLVMCADDDVNTPGNPGRTKAEEAARAVGGCVAVPDFGKSQPTPEVE